MSKKIIGVTVGTPLSPRAIKEKLNPVTSVNGTKADENGNVQIEVGGSGGGTASAIPVDEMLEFLMDIDLIQPLANANNEVYVDANNKLYVL